MHSIFQLYVAKSMKDVVAHPQKNLIGELIKIKQQLAESEELGTMKAKIIRGVGYGLQKDTFCSSIPASTSNPTNAQLMRYIVLLEERFTSLEGEKQPLTHDVDEEGGEEGDLDVL